MADVTISQLTRGIPSGGHVLPYSTGSSTLGVPVSSILSDAGNIGIGTTIQNTKLDVKGVGIQNFNTLTGGVVGPIAVQGTGPAPSPGNNDGYHSCLDFKVSHTNQVGGRIALQGNDEGSKMKFGTSNLNGTNLITAITIDPNGYVDINQQPHISGQLQNNSGNGYANNANVQQSNGNMTFRTTGTTGVVIPASGIYLITINMISGFGSGRNDTRIIVNDEEIVALLNDGNTGYRQRSGSIAWRCNVNDVIRFWSDNWYDITDLVSHWKTFSVTKVG